MGNRQEEGVITAESIDDIVLAGKCAASQSAVTADVGTARGFQCSANFGPRQARHLHQPDLSNLIRHEQPHTNIGRRRLGGQYRFKQRELPTDIRNGAAERC